MAPDPAPAPAEPKRVLFTDTRTGTFFLIEVPETSPWHELLPDHQEAEIRPCATAREP